MQVLDTAGWTWARSLTTTVGRRFWVGTDPNGGKWVSKLRGSFRGYRELVFERLLHHLGISGQASAFARLSDSDLSQLGASPLEPFQLLSPLLEEHGATQECWDCPITKANEILREQGSDPLERLRTLEPTFPGILDWPRGEILAPLIGANEPPDPFVTPQHQMVIMDGELSFSHRPSDVRETTWWLTKAGDVSEVGKRLTLDLCEGMARLSEVDLQRLLEVPSGVHLEMGWEIRPVLEESRRYAESFLAGSKFL